MKHLALFAAMTASSIAIAHAQPTMVENQPQSMETQVYDGPDSNTPGQPGPDGSEPAVQAQRLDTYQPTQRGDRPVCNEATRDNCAQAIDPGGSDPIIAGEHGAMDHGTMDHGAMDHGSMDHGDMDMQAPADGSDMNQPDPNAVGGPAAEDEWYVNTPSTTGRANATPARPVTAQRLDAYQPFVRDSYPACSASVQDNCVQRYNPR